MEFKDFLVAIFPHRWLNPGAPGNTRLFTGLGVVLDQMDDLVNQIQKEMLISTAVETIPAREAEYGLPIDPSLTLATRRANLINKKRERGGPINKDELIKTLRTYGIEAMIQNIHSLHVMKIKIVSTKGEPDNFTQIKQLVEGITRAHVGKEWEFSYTAYGEIMGWGLTYGQIKALGLTYGQMSIYQQN